MIAILKGPLCSSMYGGAAMLISAIRLLEDASVSVWVFGSVAVSCAVVLGANVVDGVGAVS
jgi:hypothetical protein